MRLGWDEIARRAKAFSEEWKDAHYEKGETQSFYNDFFEVFGIRRRTVADDERRVKLLDNRQGFIDLFWPRTLLIEQKSATLDLRKAETQALDYLVGIHPTEQPRFILTCDFQNWVLRDRDGTGEPLRFKLADLHKHVQAFDFMLGRRVSFERQEAVTIKAAELMGRIHDALKANGYTGHDLERYLVRLLFCMFADDTGIFQPKDIFLQLIENDTAPDGSNVGRVINELFEVLDTPEDKRQAVLDARAAHPTSSLADLYDPDTMPGNLRKAHRALDLAVDRLYRRAPFESDRDRVEHLFGLYEKLVNSLSDAEHQSKRYARKGSRKTA